MKLKIAVLGLLASTAQVATAFSPKAFVPKKSLVTPQSPDVWRPPMNMVAGGAEKAYGEEYYDGEQKYLFPL